MSFILPVTSFSIFRAIVRASPTPVQVYVFSIGSIGLVPKKSLFVAPLQLIGNLLKRYVLEPHPEIVNELLCVFSLLVSMTPEKSRYLWQIHRVLRGKKVVDNRRTPIRI